MNNNTSMDLVCLFVCLFKFKSFDQFISPKASYGKGPYYFLLKTAIFPTSMFLLLFSMKFGTKLENDQFDSFK